MKLGFTRIGTSVAAAFAVATVAMPAYANVGAVYSGNIASSTASYWAGKLGATPRGPEVVAQAYGWNGTELSVHIRVVRINPYRQHYGWTVAQMAAVDLSINGKTVVTVGESTTPGGALTNASCGNGGTVNVVPAALGISYTTNTWVMRIPRTSLAHCGIHAGQTVSVLMVSGLGVNGGMHFGAWTAAASSYRFRA